MADDRTERFALPFLIAGQAQKEVTHNEALTLLDIAMWAAVESADIAVPPVSPSPGQCWIVAAGAGGAWEGRTSQIAGWTIGGWRFMAAAPGMEAWVVDRGGRMRWDGDAWISGAVRADGFYQDGVRVLGPRAAAIDAPVGGTTIDAESRLAIAAILEMLQAHGIIATAP